MGSGGVGKVYSGSISKSGKNNTIDSRKRYTAVVAYAFNMGYGYSKL